MNVTQEKKHAYGWMSRPKAAPTVAQLAESYKETQVEHKSCATKRGNKVFIYDDSYSAKPQKDCRMVYELTDTELAEFTQLTR